MGMERIYGLHTVRALLARTPQRVLRVYLQQGRSDQRAGQIEAQARAAQRPVERVDAGRLRAWVGEAAHQGVVAEIEPLRPMSEAEFFEQLGPSPTPWCWPWMACRTRTTWAPACARPTPAG